jgi:dCTP deaminase
MSIRPDTWIARMAKEYGMIEPFVEEQVRSIDGRSVISFGISSYGYDIRVSNKFRIFTNVYKTLTPKGL